MHALTVLLNVQTEGRRPSPAALLVLSVLIPSKTSVSSNAEAAVDVQASISLILTLGLPSP